MRTYLLNITGAVIITVFTQIILDKKWSKYVKIITGIIIISAIATPVTDRININIESFFKEQEEYREIGGEYQSELLQKEMEKRVNEDCKNRIINEFGVKTQIKSSLKLDNDGKILGVLQIEILGDKIDEKIIKRIYEVYAPAEVIVNGYKKDK